MAFIDFGDFFDELGGGGGDEREAFADELGALEVDLPDDLDAIEWSQWEALLEEYVESGQMTEEQLEGLREWWGEHDEDAFLWEIDYDAPDGDAYEEK